jgi:hypothetical protein
MLEPPAAVRGPNEDRFVNGQVAGVIRVSVPFTMQGLKRDRTARVVVAGHAFVQNLRRGFYDLGTDERPGSRLASAFSELASVI